MVNTTPTANTTMTLSFAGDPATPSIALLRTKLTYERMCRLYQDGQVTIELCLEDFTKLGPDDKKTKRFALPGGVPFPELLLPLSDGAVKEERLLRCFMKGCSSTLKPKNGTSKYKRHLRNVHRIALPDDLGKLKYPRNEGGRNLFHSPSLPVVNNFLE